MTQNHHHPEHDHKREGSQTKTGATLITIRPHSGLSGDILLTGLALFCLDKLGFAPETPEAQHWLSTTLGAIMPELANCVAIAPKLVNGIAGWHAYVDLPHAHEHRSPADIRAIIEKSTMPEDAKKTALECFHLLALCEAKAHGIQPEKVHFHEVGALDSILDICAVSQFWCLLEKPAIICGPIPLADGAVQCQHGLLPTPAPAVLELLTGIATCSFAGSGETLTPTAAALLHSLHVAFGAWPAMKVFRANLVYGGKVFANAPNGVAFAIGESFA